MAKKTAPSTTKQFFYNRTFLNWIITILLLIIIWLLLAIGFKAWPFNSSEPTLGTAFYSGTLSDDTNGSGNNNQSDGNANGGTGSNGNNGSSNGGGGNTGGGTNTDNGGNSGGSNGGGSGDGNGSSSSPSPILTLAANLNRGDTKDELKASVNGLNENCTVVVDTAALGKQEVCVYTEGNKVVTVTLLNNRVLSASRSGF